MSTCISRHGEYSDHETTEGNYICDLCGVLDEDGIFAELDRLRTENERLLTAWTDDQGHRDAILEQAEARIDQLTDENATLREGNRVACGRFEVAERRTSELEADLATVRDTLTLRTQSHAALVRTRLACPTCSTLPLEETPGE